MATDKYNIDGRSDYFEKASDQRERGRIETRPRVQGHKPDEQRTRHRTASEAIHEAGSNLHEVMISYTKITEDYATRIWQVEPYSYRFRYLTSGGRWKPPRLKKVFFGYDVLDDTIKMFMFDNIWEALETDTTFTPRWKVEIGFRGVVGLSGREQPEVDRGTTSHPGRQTPTTPEPTTSPSRGGTGESGRTGPDTGALGRT
jgi:hypothetical protein